VKGIVPRAAWHWGSDSSVVNDPLGEPGHSPLYVGFHLCGAHFWGLEGGVPCWGPWRIDRKGSGFGHLFP